MIFCSGSPVQAELSSFALSLKVVHLINQKRGILVN